MPRNSAEPGRTWLRRATAWVRRTRVRSSDGAVVRTQPASAGVDPLAAYTSLLPSGRRLKVVILAEDDQRTHIDPWLTRFGNEDCHVISDAAAPEWSLEDTQIAHHVASTDAGRSGRLKVIGAPDVLVNLLDSDHETHLEMWRRFFFHVAKDGVYIIDRRAKAQNTFPNSLTNWLATLADADQPDTPPKIARRNAELLAAIAGLVVTRDLIAVKKRNRHYLKVRHSEAHLILPSREPNLTVEVLHTLPRGEVRSTATVNLHQSTTAVDHVLERFPYPQLHVRHYRGKISFAGSGLFYTGATILPDSFRHHLIRTPTNPKLTSVSPSFARITRHERATGSLAGNYYNLDNVYSGHFGHLTTEVVSRLWGWDHAKAEIPDLKVIMRIPKETHHNPELERRIITAYGIPEDDIVCVTEPVLLESVVSATPMWHNAEPHYVHPAMIEVWERLTNGLIDRDAPAHERIFVSRSSRWKHRVCRNADEVERFFESHGFAVIYPEELSLGQQVGIFAQATTVAGFGGSALFNMMHARRMKTTIVLSHEAYTARNEHLFAALLGTDLHYFWSSPDVQHPEGDWDLEAFYSEWEFDFDRNRAALEEVIAGL